jgi:hypothetical protein
MFSNGSLIKKLEKKVPFQVKRKKTEKKGKKIDGSLKKEQINSFAEIIVNYLLNDFYEQKQ